MTFYLKILNEAHRRRHLKVNGNSGARFLFVWDPKLRSYCYHPANQDEVDDLYRTMGRTTLYIFAPVSIPSAKPAAVAPAGSGQPALGDDARYTLEQASALLAAQLPTREPLTDSLVEQCLHRHIIVTEDDSNETADRLVKAYDKGAKDALESVPTSTRKPRKNPPARRAPKSPKSEPATPPSNEN